MCSFYKDDICLDELLAQLPLLHSLFVQESEGREATIDRVSTILSNYILHREWHFQVYGCC